jgi:hypothetical protein
MTDRNSNRVTNCDSQLRLISAVVTIRSKLCLYTNLYIQQKPCLVLDKSKIINKHESFSDQIMSTIREACRIAYYNRVPFVKIDDSSDPKVDFNAPRTMITTVVDGLKMEYPIVYAHLRYNKIRP